MIQAIYLVLCLAVICIHTEIDAQSCRGRCGNIIHTGACLCDVNCIVSDRCCQDFWSTCIDIKLSDGDAPNEGRVELVLGSARIGSICADGWSIMDATVSCNQLGYPGASLRTTGAIFGPGNLTLVASRFLCDGGERKLTECNFTLTVGHCSTGGVAGVICQKPGYQGCFGRPSSSLLLQDHYLSDPAMTGDQCIQHCSRSKYELAAVRGSDCTCGLGIPIDSDYYHDYRCRMPCPGDPRQICGGYTEGRLMVYKTNTGFCRHPGNPLNGQRHGDYFRFGSWVRYTCDSGYNLRGNTEIQCIPLDDSERPIKSITWHGIAPVCIREQLQSNDTDVGPAGPIKKAGNIVEIVVGVVVVFLVILVIIIIIFLWRMRRKMKKEETTRPSHKATDSGTSSGSQHNGPIASKEDRPVYAVLQPRSARESAKTNDADNANSEGNNVNSNRNVSSHHVGVNHEYFTSNVLTSTASPTQGQTIAFYSTKIKKSMVY